VPIISLTKSNIDAIQPGAKDDVYWDRDLKGFGLKVTPAGGKVYLIQYRLGGRAGKTERYRIGPHGQYTPDQARRIAKGLLGKVAEGISPQEEKRQAKQDRTRASDNTTAALIDRYYHTYLLPKWRRHYADSVHRRMKCHLLPRFGARKFASITRAEKYELLDSLIAEGKTGAVQNVRSDLSALESWALDRGIIASANGQRMKLNIPSSERKRVFVEQELRTLVAQFQAMPEPIRTGYLVLVLTLQRIESVSAMRRSMVKDNIWTQKPEDVIYKGKTEHELPLPREVMELLEMLPNTGDFYFPGVAGLTETGYAQLCGSSRKNKISQITGVKDWTWHDFRRTGTTWLQDAGFPPHYIDAVLGHTAKGETSAFKHYGRAKMLRIKEQTLQAWVNHVLHPERRNVTHLVEAA
jgi:integrase